MAASNRAIARAENQHVQSGSKKAPLRQVSKKDRLIGWLVSYEKDSKGEMHEIRTGRSFISAQDMPHDRAITLDAQDISTPHMALSGTAQHRLMVQDIFSSAGSFLIRGRSGEEVIVRGPTELQHGDWLKVGESTKFQVCLIDRV